MFDQSPATNGALVVLGGTLNNFWIERCFWRNKEIFDQAVKECWGFSLADAVRWLEEHGFEPLLIDDAREALKDRGFE
jgi:hypothetical protein